MNTTSLYFYDQFMSISLIEWLLAFLIAFVFFWVSIWYLKNHGGLQ